MKNMEDKYYGVNANDISSVDQFDVVVEEITIQGYSVVNDLLSEEEVVRASKSMDEIYQKQEAEFGRENMIKIHELNLARCPLSYDDLFLNVCMKPGIANVVKYFLGDYYTINQQNGIINMPSQEHHQSSWHRDLPYQDYIISKPIAISCLICIDDFREETGSTFVLPFSHQLDNIPSTNYIQNHKVNLTAKKGSAILFNSMLYHKAGYNRSDQVRRGLNTVFSIPLLKQQINLFDQLEGRHAEDSELRKILGYDSQVPPTVLHWRQNHLNRKK